MLSSCLAPLIPSSWLKLDPAAGAFSGTFGFVVSLASASAAQTTGNGRRRLRVREGGGRERKRRGGRKAAEEEDVAAAAARKWEVAMWKRGRGDSR